MKVEHKLYITGWTQPDIAQKDIEVLEKTISDMGIDAKAILVPNQGLYMIIFNSQEDMNVFRLLTELQPLKTDYGQQNIIYEMIWKQ